MQTAIMTANNTPPKAIKAELFEELYGLGNGGANITLVSPNDALPVVFRRSHTRLGNEERVRACFAYAPGYAPEESHIFDHRKADTLRQAVASGKNVVLSLNTDLSYRALNFREMQAQGVQRLEHWMNRQRGNYISVSIRSTKEAVKTLQTIHQTDPAYSMNNHVFALYRGALLPYRNFYLGLRKPDLCRLFDDMRDLEGGVKYGETATIGFPRMIRFLPAQTSIESNGAKGLKGNRIQRDDVKKVLLSRLIFSDEQETRNKPSYRGAFNLVAQNKNDGIYVMASPVVNLKEQNGAWQLMRWVINDPNSQMCERGLTLA